MPKYLNLKKGNPTVSDGAGFTSHLELIRGVLRFKTGAPGSTSQSVAVVKRNVLSQYGIISTPSKADRSRDPNDYTWEDGVIIDGSWLSANGYGTGTGDVVIQNRNFKSTDPNVSAAFVNTTRRVTFINCNFFAYAKSVGVTGHCIKLYYNSQKVRVYNCLFFSGNPMQALCSPAKAVVAQGFKELIVENCEMYGTSGMQGQSFGGDLTGASPTVTIRYNKFVNLDGRMSDPTNQASGFWKEGNSWGSSTSDFNIANLIQFNGFTDVPNIEIAYNDVECFANQSRFEDIVSFYCSSGTPTSPIWVHHNFFRGGYVFDRWCDLNTATWHGNNYTSSTSSGYTHSGGGGLLGDGRAGSDVNQDSNYVLFEDNISLDMANYGIGIAAGHHQVLRRNKIYRSGYVHGIPRAVKIAWSHVPIQVQDYYTRPLTQRTPTPSDPNDYVGKGYYTYTAADLSSGNGGTYDAPRYTKYNNGDPAQGIDSSPETVAAQVRWYANEVYDNSYAYVSFTPSNGAINNKGPAWNSPLMTQANNINEAAGLSGTALTNFVTRDWVDAKAQSFRDSIISAGYKPGLTPTYG